MILFHYLLLLSLGMCIYINYPHDITINHARSLFGPAYNGTDVIGKLIVSDPFSTCTVVNNNIRDKIVLVEDVGHKKHCDYAFLVYTMQQHGAKGVIVVDREKQQSLKFMNSRDHNTTKNIVIPSVFISKSSSSSILSLLQNDFDVEVVLNTVGEIPYRRVVMWRVFTSLYIMILLFLLGGSLLYFSECCIVKRVLVKSNTFQNQMKSSVYSMYDCGRFITRPEQEADLNDDCAICLETFHPGDSIIQIACCHYFHSQCIEPWLLKHSMHCPVCKQAAIEMDCNSEQNLQKEFKRQQDVFTFWLYYFVINIIFVLLLM